MRVPCRGRIIIIQYDGREVMHFEKAISGCASVGPARNGNGVRSAHVHARTRKRGNPACESSSDRGSLQGWTGRGGISNAHVLSGNHGRRTHTLVMVVGRPPRKNDELYTLIKSNICTFFVVCVNSRLRMHNRN